MVLLVRIEDGAEILAKKPGGAVSALAWTHDGASSRSAPRMARRGWSTSPEASNEMAGQGPGHRFAFVPSAQITYCRSGGKPLKATDE